MRAVLAEEASAVRAEVCGPVAGGRVVYAVILAGILDDTG
jgi:hypothetical protein